MKPNSEKDYSVPALIRGLSILNMFNDKDRVLSTNDFAERLGVSVSSIYRIVQTLSETEYLTKLARNTYSLGPAVISLGYAYLAGRDIIDISVPHLNKLRDNTSVSCHLGVREGRHVLYLYRALAAQRLVVNIPVGSRIPCHSSALGRVLLSSLKDQDLEILYNGIQLDSAAKPNPQSLPELKQRINEERKQGFSVNHSDYSTAIAAPIRSHTNEIIAAINVSGPDVFILDESVHADITEQLRQTALAISTEMGFRADFYS